MIASPNDLAAAKGIELRQRRKSEERAKHNDELHYTPDEIDRDLICALPLSGRSAAVALGVFFQRHGNCINFKFITEVAPIVSKNFPADWKRMRDHHNTPGHEWSVELLDKLAAGPLLEGDDLVRAVYEKLPDRDGNHFKPPLTEPANAQ
jgi:hypothetical protein